MIRRFTTLFAILLWTSAAWGSHFPGQGQGHRGGNPAAQQAHRAQQQQRNQAHNQSRDLADLPPKWVDHIQEMSPEEQERFMKNNERFKQLSPEGQAQIRDKLRYWNGLSPDEREALRDRQRVWEQLTPAQQDHIQRDLLPKWQQLPDDRRQAVLSRLRGLNNMSESERAAKLSDPEYMRGLSPDEQDMLKNLSALRVTPSSLGAAPPGSNYQ